MRPERLNTKRLACSLAGVLIGSFAIVAGAAEPAVRQLDIDASRVVGQIRSLQGAAGLPRAVNVEGAKDLPDLTASWRDAGINFVRTFDWFARLDTADNPRSLFPKWSADPDNPASYNFAAADEWIRSVRALGAEVMFTLATEIPGSSKPAADLAKYERVVRRIVEHYTKGWANGMQQAVRWWEFGDQPDFFKTHFDGTPAQFYDMYAAAARAVKSVDPTLRIGGPNLAFPLNRDAPYREGFLKAVRDRGLPLDFLSWIWFSDTTRDPLDFVRVAADVQSVLESHGLRATPQILASFNMTGIANAKPDALQGASFLTAAMIYLQDAKIERAAVFRADTGWDLYHRFVDPAHLFTAEGKLDPRGQAYTLMGRMRETPQRLAVGGDDDKGYAVLAGRDAAGTRVQILVTNYRIPAEYIEPTDREIFSFILPLGPERANISFRVLRRRGAEEAGGGEAGYALKLRNLPWGDAPFTARRYRVDATHAAALIGESSGSGGALQLSAELPANAVELIDLRPAP